MQKVKYELSIVDLKRLRKDIEEIGNVIKSKAFLEFIAKKCVTQIKQICATKLSSAALDNTEKSSYMQNHKYSIRGNKIILYNDSQIDISSKNMSEETRAKYKAELSLGKIVEFGIGYVGKNGSYSYIDEDWQYDVNDHGYKGWYYVDDMGNTVWTNGFAGKQIYADLMDSLDELMPIWFNEYLKLNNI